MRMARSLLLLLMHSAEHSWSSRIVGSHTAVSKRTRRKEVIMVSYWRGHVIDRNLRYINSDHHRMITHTRMVCPLLLLLLGSRVVVVLEAGGKHAMCTVPIIVWAVVRQPGCIHTYIKSLADGGLRTAGSDKYKQPQQYA